jgi:hypothetical protein
VGPKRRAIGTNFLGNCNYPLKYQINGSPAFYVLAMLGIWRFNHFVDEKLTD